jgi:IclR family KDG regulon transcriptional repressor
MLIDSGIIYVRKVDSRHMLDMCSSVGRRAPIHCTAIGKVLLAWENAECRAHALAGMTFERFRDKTITDHAAFFIQELDRTNAQGLGQDREEFDDHIRCLGMPVRNQAVAGLSVSLPILRFNEARIRDRGHVARSRPGHQRTAGLHQLPAGVETVMGSRVKAHRSSDASGAILRRP